MAEPRPRVAVGERPRRRLAELFTDGGATVTTVVGERPQLVARTAIQPGGDSVWFVDRAVIRRRIDLAPHAEAIARWYAETGRVIPMPAARGQRRDRRRRAPSCVVRPRTLRRG